MGNDVVIGAGALAFVTGKLESAGHVCEFSATMPVDRGVSVLGRELIVVPRASKSAGQQASEVVSD
jgi:hypothetical protein